MTEEAGVEPSVLAAPPETGTPRGANRRRWLWGAVLGLLGIAGAGCWYLGWERPARLRRAALEHARRGAERYAAGDLPGAVKELETATRLDPGRAEAFHMLGRTERRLDGRRGLPALARAARLAPGDADYLRDYGVALRDAGDTDQARAVLGAAVRVAPSDPVAHVELARAYLGRVSSPEDRQKGMADLRTALLLRPGDVETRFRLARACFQDNQFEEARKEFRTSLFLLGQGARQTGEPMDGRTESAARWLGLVKSCYHYLSQVAYRTGRADEARHHQALFDDISGYITAADQLLPHLKRQPDDAAARADLARLFQRYHFPPAGPDGKAAADRWVPGS
jgi:cytochrome c-type biogenesis protein CcmH/NrfG